MQSMEKTLHTIQRTKITDMDSLIALSRQSRLTPTTPNLSPTYAIADTISANANDLILQLANIFNSNKSTKSIDLLTQVNNFINKTIKKNDYILKAIKENAIPISLATLAIAGTGYVIKKNPTILDNVQQKGSAFLEQIKEHGNTVKNFIHSYLDPDYLLRSLPAAYGISNFEDLMTKKSGNDNHTALHLACINNDVESIKIMCQIAHQHGTDLLSQPDNNGCLPIHLAAGFGQSAAITTLIQIQRDAGRNPWQLIAHCDNNNNTPLHIAVKNSNIETTQALINVANNNLLNILFMQDKYHQTVLQCAQQEEDPQITEVLTQALQTQMTNAALLKLIQKNLMSCFNINTENEAEALNFLKEKYLKPMDCSICFETKSGAEYDIMDCCNQPFCSECLMVHLESCLIKGNSKELKCPNQNCSKILEEPLMRTITLHNNAIYDQYLEICLQEYLNKDSLTRHCLTPNCVFQFLKDPDCGETIICESCKKEYCSECLFDHNLNITCDQAKTERDPNLTDAASIAWIMENTRQCIQCGNAVERNKGCNHMTCKCGYEFCYVCGKKWGSLSCPFYNHPPV